jgi:adenylosuccinate lyase
MVSLAELSPPIALGALDGRYRSVVAPLLDHLSEAALNRTRLRVEIEWLVHLTENDIVPGARPLSPEEQGSLFDLVERFGTEEIEELARIERETVHDVKAVEYFLRGQLTRLGREDLLELVHFGFTSEDVNNLCYALMVRGAVQEVWLPAAEEVTEQLAVLAHRLSRQLRRVGAAEYLGKVNGATGTYGAYLAAVPEADWQQVSREFVTGLGLTWNPLTTQIESHDWQAELYADMARFNRVLHNLCTDVWSYISLGYFAQVRGQGTVGSSTMPHKVNPIRFENAEANLEVSNALLDVLGSTLVTSRLQRDLTDSSMQRNIGSAFGHSLLALDNVRRGLAGLDPVPEVMAADLDANWEVLAEPIQSVMRALAVAGHPGMSEPYERLKGLTRGRRVTAEDLRAFVRGLGLTPEAERRLLELTPQTYVGLAPELVDHLDDEPE